MYREESESFDGKSFIDNDSVDPKEAFEQEPVYIGARVYSNDGDENR